MTKTVNNTNIETCTQNLIEIGKAIETYQKEHGDFPEWLSELYPKYLQNENSLLCPADEGEGKTKFTFNADPITPVSYGYQLHPEYREEKTEQRKVYGDAMPLVRCRHHADQPLPCLNLSYAYKVYPSSYIWERKPEEMYENPEKAISALEAGLNQHPDHKSFYYIYPMLAHFYIEVNREKDVGNLINRLQSILTSDNFQGNFNLGVMLEIAKRDEEAIAVYQKLEEQNPNSRNILLRLAQIHERLDNTESAAEYWKKAATLPIGCGC